MVYSRRSFSRNKGYEEKMDMNKFNAPIHVNLEITKRCNHFCDYCYNGIRDNTVKERPYTTNHFRKLTEILCEGGIFSLTISGGEPFLRTDAIIEVLSVTQKHNVDVSLNSNLTYVPSDVISILKEYPPLSILTSVYSYDSAKHDRMTKKEGSLNKTLKNIERIIKESDITLGVNCVVTTENISDMITLKGTTKGD